MKKLLITMLLATLLLVGCADKEGTLDTTPTTEETLPQGCQIPDSDITTSTQNAVWVYDPQITDIQAIATVGDRLMVVWGENGDNLTVFNGNEGLAAAQMQLEKPQDEIHFQNTYDGVAYYAKEENQVHFLDSQLQITKRITMPQGISGEPLVSAQMGEIYYCLDQNVFGLDMEEGISRQIKTVDCVKLQMQGCYFDGKVLAVQAETRDGQFNTIYFSGENGKTLAQENGIDMLSTFEDTFFVHRMAGIIEQRILGTLDGTSVSWNVQGNILPALELGAMVTYQTGDDGVLTLNAYDHATGLRTASVSFQSPGSVISFVADRWSNCIWLLIEDETAEQMILRWNLKSSPVSDETAYTSVLYTADNPDNAGLKECQKRVDGLNRTYGVRIRIWQDAVKYIDGHSVVAEHLPQAINSCLDELEAAFAVFPNKFLSRSVATQIRICIVRSIDGKQDAAQFWYDGDAFILICPGADLSDVFIRELGNVVNSHILGNSPAVDSWDVLNPEGFDYADSSTHLDSYLQGAARAFVDKEAMTSVTKDRSRLFWQAMQPDNQDMFASEIIQAKLNQLCQGIRHAWRWQKESQVFPWEQYLNTPIAVQ